MRVYVIINALNHYIYNALELIPAKCAEDSNETQGQAPMNKGSVVIFMLCQLQIKSL